MDLEKGMNMAKEALSKTNPEVKMPESVFLKSCHGTYLSAQLDGRAKWDREHAEEWERIRLEKTENGKYGLKSCHGKYLSAQPDGRLEWDRDKLDIWEEWTIEPQGDKVALKSHHGKYLSAQDDGWVEVNRDKIGAWETFTMS
jgi:hypothetical protein